MIKFFRARGLPGLPARKHACPISYKRCECALARVHEKRMQPRRKFDVAGFVAVNLAYNVLSNLINDAH